MMDINNVNITGRLTKDVEVRTSSGGVIWCTFHVAVERKRKQNEAMAQTDFIRCTAWNGTAEYLGKYGKKGDFVAIAGSIQTGSYENKDDQKIYYTEINVQTIKLNKQSIKEDAQPTVEVRSGYEKPQTRAYKEATKPQPNLFDPTSQLSNAELDINADDLPF